MRKRTLLGAAVLALGLAGILVPLAAAQTPPDFPDADGDGIPDIPVGLPGKYDLREGDGIFGQFVDVFGETTQVADFGSGSKLTGACGGFAYSYDSDGQLIDAAFDAGTAAPPLDLDPSSGTVGQVQAFTSDNPFLVDAAGTVVYYGQAENAAGEGPLDHRWFIRTQGISLDKGGDPNTAGNNRNAGLVDLGEELPIKFTGLFRIEGELTSLNGITCDGEGWFELTGPFPPFTVIGALVTVLLGAGIFGLLFNSRPAITWKE